MIQRSVSDYSSGRSSRMTRIITIIVGSGMSYYVLADHDLGLMNNGHGIAAVYSAWLLMLITTTVAGMAALFILLNSVSTRPG